MNNNRKLLLSIIALLLSSCCGGYATCISGVAIVNLVDCDGNKLGDQEDELIVYSQPFTSTIKRNEHTGELRLFNNSNISEGTYNAVIKRGDKELAAFELTWERDHCGVPVEYVYTVAICEEAPKPLEKSINDSCAGRSKAAGG